MTEIHDRVTQLEHDMAEVRYLASKADKETSRNTATLQGQVGLLNALRETQVDHGKTLAKHGKRLDRLEHKVDAGFAQVDKNFAQVNENFAQVNENFAQVNKNFAQVNENFAKVEEKLGVLHTGIANITGLLTDKIDEPGEN